MDFAEIHYWMNAVSDYNRESEAADGGEND